MAGRPSKKTGGEDTQAKQGARRAGRKAPSGSRSEPKPGKKDTPTTRRGGTAAKNAGDTASATSASARKRGSTSAAKKTTRASGKGNGSKTKATISTDQESPAAGETKKRRVRKPTETAPMTKSVTEVTCGIEPSPEDIRRRAYEIYLGRGAAAGDPTADWLQAERELRGKRVSRRAD